MGALKRSDCKELMEKSTSSLEEHRDVLDIKKQSGAPDLLDNKFAMI